MDANKLANQRRYIIRNKKLTDIDIEQIKEQVINDTQKENYKDNTNKYDDDNKNRNNNSNNKNDNYNNNKNNGNNSNNNDNKIKSNNNNESLVTLRLKMADS